MVFHFAVVEVIQQKGRAFLDDDGVIAPVKRGCGLERDLSVEVRRREQVAAHEHELEEDLFELVGVRVYYLVFLESFKGT